MDQGLSASRPVSLLRVEGGPTLLWLSPTRASDLGLSDAVGIGTADLTARLERSGVSLNDPDVLCHLTAAEKSVVRDSSWGAQTRRLTGDDAAAFAALTAEAPAHDLGEAYVELGHWLVVGTFVGARLISAASAYPWRETRLADIG